MSDILFATVAVTAIYVAAGAFGAAVYHLGGWPGGMIAIATLMIIREGSK